MSSLRDHLENWIDTIDVNVTETPLIAALSLQLPREIDRQHFPSEGGAVGTGQVSDRDTKPEAVDC